MGAAFRFLALALILALALELEPEPELLGGTVVWVVEGGGDASGGLRRRWRSVGRADSEERARCRRELVRDRSGLAAGADVVDGVGAGEVAVGSSLGMRERWRLASGLNRCDKGRCP